MMASGFTLDPDVQLLLQAAADEQNKPVEVVLNESLRHLLARNGARDAGPYTLVPRALGLPTVDLTKALSLADELSDEDLIRRSRE
jgi:hypothetical protein